MTDGRGDNIREDRKDGTLGDFIREVKELADEDVPRAKHGKPAIKRILGGTWLDSEPVKNQIWVVLFVAAFAIAYITSRYQCQQSVLRIDELNKELKDAHFKALSVSSRLTEKSRESKIMELLKQTGDSVLHMPEQPPYIIEIPQ